MLDVSEDEFTKLVGEALDALPQEYVKRLLQNVAVTWEEEPSEEQRETLKLRGNQTLFGLYEGLPLTDRYNGVTKITPDKITIFKGPITAHSHDRIELKDQIKRTVWHEMAHYFGLDHNDIHKLEN